MNSVRRGKESAAIRLSVDGIMNLVSPCSKLPVTDLSPFRAIRKEVLLALNMQEMTFGWPTEMMVKAAQAGYRLEEVPVRYRPRLGGKSKISGTVRGTILAGYYILTTTFRYAWGNH